MKKNGDGSVEVLFVPEAPAGKEGNWVPTKRGEKFELLFRLYAPTEDLFDKNAARRTLRDLLHRSSSLATHVNGRKLLMHGANWTDATKSLTLGLALGCAVSGAHAQNATPVTVDNFIRAETDLYFQTGVKQAAATGRFFHYREPMTIDEQTVVRANRDTLYSAAVVDLDGGPVTISLPEAGDRFRSLMVINEDHYVVGDIEYRPGDYTYDRQKVGTRYAMIGLRTLVDPSDPKDVQQVHALQDAAKISQAAPGKFEAPNWDQASQKKVRDALAVLGSTLQDFKRAFGTKEQVDPIHHLIGTATGWGGNPDKEAMYLNVTPSNNDGKTAYKLVVKDVPVDGFWSISLYNAEGYFQKNDFNAYSINNLTAKQSGDGSSVTVQFGGCDGKLPNCLPTMPGWNYTVRLYRPRADLLNGTWKFPQPEPFS